VEIGTGDIGLMPNRVASKLAHSRTRKIPTPHQHRSGRSRTRNSHVGRV